MGRVEVPEATRRELWRVAMGICARCRVELDPRVRGAEPTATVAHIIALEDGGPRADPAVTVAERNAIDNLILLCPGCHDLVDKNAVTFTVDELRRIKIDHESRMATLRQISRGWNQRFASVDYVNLPRLAMLPGGIAVQQAATAAGLDSARPFAEQGIAPGLLVSHLHPLLESWSQHAIALEPATVPILRQGALVAFEVPMAAGKSAARTRAADTFPQLLTKVAGRHVAVRFDPQWLTTSSARANVFGDGDARTFAGLARVTMVSEAHIEMSALVFGQPGPAEIAAFDFAVSSGAREVPSIELFELPDHPAPSGGAATSDAAVALLFDLQGLHADSIERSVFRQVQRVVPEFRRDVLVAVGLVVPGSHRKNRAELEMIAADVLGSAPSRRWRTVTVSSLASLLETADVAAAVIRGITLDQIVVLHDAIDGANDAYRGCLRVDVADAHQREVFGFSPGYRLIERDLHLFHGLQDVVGDDVRDHAAFAAWVQSGLFQAVRWINADGESATESQRHDPDIDSTTPDSASGVNPSRQEADSLPSELTLVRATWLADVCARVLAPLDEDDLSLLDSFVRRDLGDPTLVKAMVVARAAAFDGRGFTPGAAAKALAASGVFNPMPHPLDLEQLVVAARQGTALRPRQYTLPWDPEETQTLLQEFWSAARCHSHGAERTRAELGELWGIGEARTLDYMVELPQSPLNDYRPLMSALAELGDRRVAACMTACLGTEPVRRALIRWTERVPAYLPEVHHLWVLGADLAQIIEAEHVLEKLIKRDASASDRRELFLRARKAFAARRRLAAEAFKGLSCFECEMAWPTDEDTRFREECLNAYLRHQEVFGGVSDASPQRGAGPERGIWGPLPWWSLCVLDSEVPAARAGLEHGRFVPHVKMTVDTASGEVTGIELAVAAADQSLRIGFDYDPSQAADMCQLLLVAKSGRQMIDVVLRGVDRVELLGTVCVAVDHAVAGAIRSAATGALRLLWPDWDPSDDRDDNAYLRLDRTLMEQSADGTATSVSPRLLS